MEELVSSHKINAIVVPLEEYGSRDHDWAARIALQLVSNTGIRVVFNASLYNPIYLVDENPKKVLEFIKRLLPFVQNSRKFPGVHISTQKVLTMTEEEREVKRLMLLEFVSQRGVIPLSQFDVPDNFELPLERSLIKIGPKYFSIPTLCIILLFILGVSFLVSTIPQSSPIAFVSLFGSVVVFFWDSRLFIEDFLLLACISIAVLLLEVPGVLCWYARRKKGLSRIQVSRVD